jgi:hypothetical protein
MILLLERHFFPEKQYILYKKICVKDKSEAVPKGTTSL